MSDHLVIVTQPSGSSGLGRYIANACRQSGRRVDVVDPMAPKLPKMWPILRAFSWDRDTWWKRRWERLLYSPDAWDRNTRLNGKKLQPLLGPGTKVLQVGKEYFPHPAFRDMEYYVFLLYNMKLALADGVTPWIPRPDERSGYLDRETQLYRSARHIFVGGAYVKDSLVRDYGVAEDRVTVAGGGVSDFFLERMPGDIAGPFTKTCLFVGWDFGMKGGEYLLQGFARAREQLPDLKLIVAGPSPAGIGAQPGVVARGPVQDKEELLRCYREADLFVMPSLRDSFGFVFLEAMSQGVPCVGSRLNAMPDIISEGETGFLVPPRDGEAVAQAILRYYRDPANRARMGAAAMRRVRDRFTWPIVVERMNRVMFGS